MTKVDFLSIDIGSIFKAHGCLWVRISQEAAASIPRHRYGVCNFIKDEGDRFVEPVPGDLIEKLVLNAENETEVQPTPQISKEQAHKMMHAIGHRPKPYNHRNNYMANESDPDWEDLVKKGLATKHDLGPEYSHHLYHVTDEGFKAIEMVGDDF